MKFRLRSLFILTTLLSVFLGVGVFEPSLAYLGASVFLPLFLGLYLHFSCGVSHDWTVAAIWLFAVFVGSIVLALGSFYFTFIQPSVGILVGGGWTSVLAAGMGGCLVGFIFGIISLIFYSIVCLVVKKTLSKQAK